MSKVYFAGSREQARQVAYLLAAMLTGRAPDTIGVARGVFLSMGFSLLSSVKDDYVVKSNKGTGRDGVKWPPLSPVTLKARRKGDQAPGVMSHKERQEKRREYIKTRTASLKKSAESERKGMIERFSLSMGTRDATAKAASIVSARKSKAERTAREEIDIKQGYRVMILRDTGVLLNSISPGQISGEGPSTVVYPPAASGGGDQILEPTEAGVIVGTNVKYAATHQNGDSSRNIPARPFLPVDDLPESYAEDMTDAALYALQAGARILYEVAA